MIAHLNINHISNKFDSLKEIIKNNIDILAISETKINSSFPNSMFDIEGYSPPFRCDRDLNGGGILVYVKEGIPCRELNIKPGAERVEGIFLEINLRKTKWLLFAGYNYSKCNIVNFLEGIGSTLDYYLCRLENFIIMGDFNSEAHENAMKEFCNTYNLKNLISKPTCFKNPLNPSSIDVILTN